MKPPMLTACTCMCSSLVRIFGLSFPSTDVEGMHVLATYVSFDLLLRVKEMHFCKQEPTITQLRTVIKKHHVQLSGLHRTEGIQETRMS